MSDPISPRPTEESNASAYELAHTRHLVEQMGNQYGLAEADTRHLRHLLWQQIRRGQRILRHIQQWLRERRLALPTPLSRSEWLALMMAAGLMVSGLGQPLLAQAQEPVGDEFQVNTETVNAQTEPSVAIDPSGNFVIVWTDYSRNQRDIYAQRYDSSGNPQGSEFQVNSHTTNRQDMPDVAMDANGNFVVTWTNDDGQDGDGTGIFAQRFDSSGNPQGNEFQVNSYTTSNQLFSAVAADTDGNFVITWHSLNQLGNSKLNIYAQRYDSNGNPQGSEFQVNSDTTDRHLDPDVAMDADGDFVITWQRGVLLGYSIYAHTYRADGTPGTEFMVNSSTTSFYANPSVAMDSDGDFAIVWRDGDSFFGGSQDGSRSGIIARRFNASATPQADEFVVNSYTTGTQSSPHIAMDSIGNFVVSWDSHQDDSGLSIQAQAFNTVGNPDGSEFRVNTYTTNAQAAPRLAMNTDGDFVVTWKSYYQDGDFEGVYAQRFNGVSQQNVYLPVVLK